MSTKRLTLEIAKERALRRGLILDSNEYINKDTKMKFHDFDGYLYSLTMDCVSDKRTKKFEPIGKYNPYFVENIENFIRINGGNAKLLTRCYVKSNEKIKLQCNCGNEYEITVCHLLGEKKFICNKCSDILRSTKQKIGNFDESKKIAHDFGYKIVEYEKRNNLVVMDKDGYLYPTTLYSMQKMKNICNKFSKNNKYTIQNMINYLKINNINIKLEDETNRKIEVRKDYIGFHCIDCGNIFYAQWGQVVYPRKNTALRHRCENCTNKQSNLEYIVEEYLKEKEINYIKEYRFDDCRNIKPLPFDFYLCDYNCVLEVQGHQHYYENDMFSQSLNERIRIDEIKKRYCKINSIGYIAIPSWKICNNHDKKSYKNIIDNILNQK